ncbi:MAG: KpsF/GutQ family sugar-phosphate isomerase [Planctomycetota bacterium]|nr:KpsF/GutQ family sugar-phosphate isomerase [Planctomycetota bacterium]
MGTSETGSSRASDRLERAREVIRVEARTIARLEQLLDQRFVMAIDLLLECRGKVVCTGMGKAGLIAQKVSATLASTGADSIYLHPAEALHGDLGRIRPGDVLLALSNSGETAEVKVVVPVARKIGAKVITLTGNTQSGLAQLSDIVLDIGRVDEACPLGLAPTASTSAMLALGDALAMVLSAERRFSREEYALYHPAGSLGRKLMRVVEVMRRNAELPLVPVGATLSATLRIMGHTPGKPGAALVVATDGSLAGIFTDGDLRRLVAERGELGREDPIDRFMTKSPKSVRPDQLLEEAERLLREFRVDQIPVLDEHNRPVGLLDVQDILDTRL